MPAEVNAADLPLARPIDSLDQRYDTERGWVYMTGVQALVRLPLQQRMRDAAAGLDTGGYVSGYRGSPLGRYDMELWAAKDRLAAHNVVFRPAVNEDLAATAIWGAQYVGVFPGAKVDGVFGIWYGKGPGVDRSGDPFRHANLAGSGRHGGVLALAGDDHGAKSSTVANYSDLNFVAVGIPLLYPGNAQELLDFGLHGIAMSRYSGCWSAMKVVTDVVEGGGSVHVSPDSPAITVPAEPEGLPPAAGGVHARPIDAPVPQEERLYHHKLHRVLAYARANGLNRIGGAGSGARLGILAAGKAWQDVQQALASLGLNENGLQDLGIRTFKVGLVWPLEPEGLREFAHGLQTILVVEEKRPLLEDQVRNLLYGRPQAPRIVGKFLEGAYFSPERGEAVFPNAGEIHPGLVLAALRRLLATEDGACLLHQPASSSSPSATRPPAPLRAPSFCSGCPHGRSTRLPEGSRALAGIGCHTMAMFQNPTTTTTVSHMGGEGAMWLGQQPFTTEQHVFANMGDGTYFHSGFLALRQAVAAHVPITYKLLYNGFVSMTGGQPIDGELSIPGTLAELSAEGVRRLALVTDEPAKWEGVSLPAGTTVHHRSELEAVQRSLREYPDVSVLLYDQPCATERRRLRKRGRWSDPDRRVFINSAVCEGCGDCGTITGCMSIEPLETPFGRKRRINQSSCNKDFSCVEGFCPSFVTVEGARPRRQTAAVADPVAAMRAAGDAAFATLPDPVIAPADQAFSLLVAGIGGTGVVTIGQTLAVAAHLDGLYSSNLDVTGLAQKYGAVLSHVKFAPRPDLLHATRVAMGEADCLIGCDLIVSAGEDTLARLREGAGGVVCTDMVPTSEFARNPDWNPDAEGLADLLAQRLGARGLAFEALRLSAALMGDSILANMMLLGAAWQNGLVPLSLQAIHRAIELNGVALESNRQAFLWGRRAAQDLPTVERIALGAMSGMQVVRFEPRRQESVQEMLRTRTDVLADDQDRDWAARYQSRVALIEQTEPSLARAAARGLFKLMAHKDEWEVARLYARPQFRKELEQAFEGDLKLRFHVAGGPFGRRDPQTGRLQKREVGPWLMTAFRWMAPLRRVRGTLLDPFRNSEERRLAQRLLADYEADLDRLIRERSPDRHALAIQIASWPDRVRGYGHVREAHARKVAQERADLWAQWEAVGSGGLRAPVEPRAEVVCPP
ncbi:MAG: indolepyruvate ferredoxin oxidoreductase family protein [Burkholderiaceae bacterium]